MGQTRRTLGDPAFLLVAFLGSLLAVWAFVNPLGASPDEIDHYTRALSVTGGELVGADLPSEVAEAPGSDRRAASVLDGSRVVEVPTDLDVGTLRCKAVAVDRHREELVGPRCGLAGARAATTERITAMATVEPLPYVAPGLAARVADDPEVGIKTARIGNAVLALALLTVGVLLYRRLYGDALAACFVVLVATTPTLLFVAATPSPSAIEITSVIALLPATMTIFEQGRATTVPTWCAFAVAGSLLATSRSTGPLWLAIVVAAAVGLAATRRKPARRPCTIAVGVVALAVAATVVWELAVPSNDADWSRAGDELADAFGPFRRVLQELVGVFGVTNDILIPTPVAVVWLLGTAALVGCAIVIGRRRERVTLVAVGIALAISIVGLQAVLQAQRGYSVQGRHVLALFVLLAMSAAHVLVRRGRVSPRLVLAVAALWLAAQAIAVGRSEHAHSGSLVVPLAVGAVGVGLLMSATVSWRAARSAQGP